jgi:hypothetical protein
MTRKDYQLIAEVLKDTEATEKTIKTMAEELYKASKYTLNGNKSFNTYKFERACGITNN